MLDLAYMAIASLSADSSSTPTRRASGAATVAPPDVAAASASRHALPTTNPAQVRALGITSVRLGVSWAV